MTSSLFHHMDRMRRDGGRWLEAAGLAPEEQPHRCLLEEEGVRLLHYTGGAGRGDPVLIVPAPIKRYYIWDLHPEASVVLQAQERGFSVFLSEWTEAPDDYGMARYARLIGRCVAEAQRRTGLPVHLMTHSLGGVLCVAYAALQPAHLASLVLAETPLHFGADARSAFTALLAVGPPGEAIAEDFGSVPGSFLSSVGITAAPQEFAWQRYADFAASAWNPRDLRTHLLVERWTFDEFPMPGKLYAEVVDDLYRGDRLMRGELVLDGRTPRPEEIRVPLVAVFNPRGWVVPPESIVPFYERVASRDKLLLPYEGEVGVALQHVGVLVGRQAHEALWPIIFSWIRECAAASG